MSDCSCRHFSTSGVLPESNTSGTFKDRKSTRLNSSHLVISYAVFCLKKKKKFYDVSLVRKSSKKSLPSSQPNSPIVHCTTYYVSGHRHLLSYSAVSLACIRFRYPSD